MPYSHSDNTIRAILLSADEFNLHIDLQITVLSDSSATFTLLNSYAGYEEYETVRMVSIDAQGDSYASFLVEYSSPYSHLPNFLAYYPYNSFWQEQRVGQIRAAEVFMDHFRTNTTPVYLPFGEVLYVIAEPSINNSLNKSASEVAREYKDSVRVTISPDVTISCTFDSPPLMNFLIVKGRNIKNIETHYFRVNYSKQSYMVWGTLIGLAVVFLFFVGLAVCIRRQYANIVSSTSCRILELLKTTQPTAVQLIMRFRIHEIHVTYQGGGSNGEQGGS